MSWAGVRAWAVMGLVLASCGHPEPRAAREDPPPAAERASPSERPEPEAGGESEPEPPPDPRALAAGRPLAAVGPEGFLSTWRVGEEVVAFPSWRMELEEAAPRGAASITLSATLLVPRATHAWLTLGMRGGVEVTLDGQALGA
ncbi:MAG: hypothetical protein RLP09_44155, partial [Sandaracinaceae bacterium]